VLILKTLIVVSGGDAPGINAAIHHYTIRAASTGDTVVGSVGGFAGVLNGAIIPLRPPETAHWAGIQGSMLESSRIKVLAEPDAQSRLSALLSEHRIDNLLLFGGDGTLRHIPPLLSTWGIPSIGLPTTIDNDVPGTEMTLGFDSACNYAYQAVDGVIATAHALPGRIFMLETLGGNNGNLALAVAAGANADAVLLPEYSYDENWLGTRLKSAVEAHGYALLVLCEGVRGARTLADDIPKWSGIRVRDTRLGHAQRGGMVTHSDRILASEMARLAHEGLRQGIMAGTVVVKNGQTRLHEGHLAGAPRMPDRDLYNRINGL
jgi:6-phosphofructokinase 1